MSSEDFRFHLPVRVRYFETDRQGHVNFIWHPAYFAMALADYLKTVDYAYQKMNAQGYDMLYVDAHASFHSPCYYDETLHVHCRTERIGNSSIRFAFRTTVPEGDRLIATGDITVVIVDRETMAKTHVPESFRLAAGALDNPETEI